jgi:hypothetical protein
LNKIHVSLVSFTPSLVTACGWLQRSLRIATNHYLHLGRVMGAGRTRKRRDTVLYGSLEIGIPKIPFKAIRKMGRFREAGGLHFNPNHWKYYLPLC